MKKIVIVLLLLILIIYPKPTRALDNTNFITLVNPVRISPNTTSPKESLEAEYGQVAKRELAASWLLTNEAISNEGIKEVVKQMNHDQELGIFLEVSPIFAKEAGVIYNQTDSWHRANSVFLSGYSQPDRIKLIDQVFGNFKNQFGFYPRSVGAWWIDAYSLDYIQKKYGVTSNLTVADQFSTDGYQIWGQPWTIPYYPSKNHAGMPASSLENKLDMVTIQWAPRDPFNGYGQEHASLYSTQDYFTINLGLDYFKKLIDLYGQKHQNSFGQITLGLEADFPPQNYSQTYASWLDTIVEYKNSNNFSQTNMEQFSNWYRQTFLKLSPANVVVSEDLMGTPNTSFWYQSPFYRLNLVYQKNNHQVKIRDLRVYFKNFQEPYFIIPNGQLSLSINSPSVIDSVNNPGEEWVLNNLALESSNLVNGTLSLKFHNQQEIKLTPETIILVNFPTSLPSSINKTSYLAVTKSSDSILIHPQSTFPFEADGFHFRALTPGVSSYLKTRKVIVVTGLVILIMGVGLVLIIRRVKGKAIKIILILVTCLFFFALGLLKYKQNSQEYFVSQSEIDVLLHLQTMPEGKVIVMDQVCLQCQFHTSVQPAVFVNKRGYVEKISRHPIVYNLTVFNSKTRAEARKQLLESQASYIYLVSYELYKESTPFSPGDLGIEKIYANSDAQIWRVKK